jgi:hypothetical protein
VKEGITWCRDRDLAIRLIAHFSVTV